MTSENIGTIGKFERKFKADNRKYKLNLCKVLADVFFKLGTEKTVLNNNFNGLEM